MENHLRWHFWQIRFLLQLHTCVVAVSFNCLVSNFQARTASKRHVILNYLTRTWCQTMSRMLLWQYANKAIFAVLAVSVAVAYMSVCHSSHRLSDGFSHTGHFGKPNPSKALKEKSELRRVERQRMQTQANCWTRLHKPIWQIQPPTIDSTSL